VPPTFLLIFLVFPLCFLATVCAMVGAFFPLRRIYERLGLNKRDVLWLYIPFLNVLFVRKLSREAWPNLRSDIPEPEGDARRVN